MNAPLLAYAGWTGTRRNVAAMVKAGWRLLLSPDMNLPRTFPLPYGIDNGAWGAFRRGENWREGPFLTLLERWSARADFVVLPDIVAGGLASLRLSLAWAERLALACPQLLPVQDGMVEADIRPLLGPRLGVFVGGTTAWKEKTLGRWGRLCREASAWCHAGRVNTVRRIRLCQDALLTSFDGTSATRYACTLPRLDLEVRQGHLWRDLC